jgi:phospholipase C
VGFGDGMNLFYIVGVIAIILGASFVVGITNPMQTVEGHKDLFDSVIIILHNDGKSLAYDTSKTYSEKIKYGLKLADDNFENVQHSYNPITGHGFTGFKSAMTLSQETYNLAIQNWQNGDYNTSMVNLGVVIHLICDMSIPQHTNGSEYLFDSHLEFEAYDEIHQSEYFIDSSGNYDFKTITEIMQDTSLTSHGLLKYVDGRNNDDNFSYVENIIVPLRQRNTAGVVSLFFSNLNITASNNNTSSISIGTIGVVSIFIGVGCVGIGKYRGA